MLFKRVEADEKKGKENIQWIDYIFEIMITYNNKMVHSATNLTPKEAKKPENELKVKANIAMNATKTRKYPDLEKATKSKYLRKKINWIKKESVIGVKILIPLMILKPFWVKNIIILMVVVICATNC